jgi:exopolysaccharide biosynthesis polyprenyl glycosylphosphotransferase
MTSAQKRNTVIKHLFFDALTAAIAWTLFYCYRKIYIESVKFGSEVPIVFDKKFFSALFLIVGFWLIVYTVAGSYRDIFRTSRLGEFLRTFVATLIGVILIFFTLLLDDEIFSYKNYYQSFLVLFGLHAGITIPVKMILTSQIVKGVHNRKIYFNTILIGSNEKALSLFKEMENQAVSSGNKFVGFVHVDNNIKLLNPFLNHLGSVKELKKIIEEHEVEEAIIAIESSEHESIGRILNELGGTDVIIKIIPDMYDILSGSVKMTSIFGAPLIEVNREIMPVWQQYMKRIGDIFTSLIALIILSPLLIAIAIIIKLTSKGPVFYSQERIGRYGKPFYILKFRSMYTDAEKNGPALSSKLDNRVTPFGRFLRKYRFDELPNFINVLKGEMSLVGPRPERQFFIDQIVQKAPHYSHLQKVRPGITSWGQVKYGYAENVEQMIERLKYDIIYIENMSLVVDLKILIYTIQTVLKGRGK